MGHLQVLLVCCAALYAACQGQEYVPSGGPVYVNPDSPKQVPVAAPDDDAKQSLVTQTVFGFLDFTTTIGNTVMVFSPQSEPPPVPATTPATTTPLIETRPPPTPAPTPDAITPSKIEETPAEEVEDMAGFSSVVQVIEGPASSVAAPNRVIFSKVEIRGGESSVVNVEPKEQEAEQPPRIFSSVVQVIGGDASEAPPPLAASSIVQVVSRPQESIAAVPTVVSVASPVILSSHVEVLGEEATIDEPAVQGNNIIEPEYDFLSRQPSEVVDETYRVINLRPSSKFHLKPRSSPRVEDTNPTGVVTRMGGTIVKDGVTTIHETKVIGTYISGKYAQVMQTSTKIKPSTPAKILKTAAPSFGKGRASHVEPSPAGSNHEETVALPLEALFSSAASTNQNTIRTQKSSGGAQRNRFSLRNKVQQQDSREQELDSNEDLDEYEPPKKAGKGGRQTQTQRAGFRAATKGYSKAARTSTPELATVSVYQEQSSANPARRYQQSRRPKAQAAASAAPDNSYSRRPGGFKPKYQPSPVQESRDRTTSTSLYKFKLARPQGRWSYKTTPKPRVTIRKLDDAGDNATATTPAPGPQFVPEQRAELRERTYELDENGEEIEGEVEEVKQVLAEYKEPTAVAETIKVEISTPADFKDVYYEVATIRSPYTFQVGTVKNTRFITVTSTIEKSFVESTAAIAPSSTLSEPLTENILSTLAPHYTHTLPLDSSIATLPPIALASDVETPPLETLTETFSTTQQLLKTHILPVVRYGSETSLYTLVQSYNVTRFVTAIKTLPPMEAYHFHPSRTLTDLNTRLEEAGSELHLELEFGDDNDADEPAALKALRPDVDLASVGSELDIGELDKLPDGPLRYKKTPEPLPKIATPPKQPEVAPAPPQYTQEQLQQLALLRFLNPGAANAIAQPQVVTSSRPVVKLETVYESHVLPLFDGVSTHYSTLSRPVGTLTKTEYEYVTSTVHPLPNINNLFAQPQQQQVQPQFQVTSSPIVTQTMVTQTQSKVLKLTFGAKTQFTTIFSTKVVPTVLTTYVTASVPVQQNAFNPFFQAPFQQFPFLG